MENKVYFPQNVDNLAEHGVECRIDVAPEIYVKGDASQLEQVFLNIIVNALHASLDVTTKRLRIKASVKGNRCRVAFVDHGVGISKADMTRVFDPLFTTNGEFSRDKKSALTQIKGSGLGLSLCRQIVDAHNGCIEISSKPRQGAQVFVDLPVSFFPSTAKTKDAYIGNLELLRGKSVLLVDDSKYVRAITSVYLERGGMRVVEAVHGSEALERCRSRQFDLILTDWRMPEMSGLEFIECLVAERLQLDVPIVVVSAVDEKEAFNAEHSLARPHYFLGKPFSESELHQHLVNIITN